MSLYIVLTIDGDWNEYFFDKLPKVQRRPDEKTLLDLIKHEINIAARVNGKFLHFAHNSSVTNDFFLRPKFISLWKSIEAYNGGIGVHCHYEGIFHDGCCGNREKMKNAISFFTKALTGKGLSPVSYRGGYMTFCENIIPIMEENGLFLDFSCDPGRYLHKNRKLIADWRGAPGNYYRMSYENRCKPGNSKVFEIPLGKAGGGALYIDITSLWGIWKAARTLAKKAKEQKRDIIVSALSHTYEFSSFRKRLKIRLALLICKRYGIFINDKEALGIINKTEGAQSK